VAKGLAIVEKQRNPPSCKEFISRGGIERRL
jgi:hypothetical protein